MNITMRKPTHPGRVLLEDVIKPLGLTVTEAARRLGVTRKALNDIVHEKVPLSLDISIRIGEATNTTPESWYLMQVKLNYWNALKNKPKNIIKFDEKKTA
jgi:addiction module HigA family antidote